MPLAVAGPIPAQQAAAPAVPGIALWVQQAASYQIEELHHSSWALRYRVHRVDTKEDTTRDLIESAGGNVARTIARSGRPLTPEQDTAEQQRLRSLSSGDLLPRRQASDTPDKYATELIRAMPSAMLYTLAAVQTQLPQFPVQQVVLEYKPNPDFHPASTAESVLKDLTGRVWLDAETHHVLRLEINITRNVNLALGLLVRVYAGGTVVYEQRPVSGGHSVYSHIEMNVVLRELLVKTAPYHSTLDTSDVTVLPSRPSLQDAVSMLLNK